MLDGVVTYQTDPAVESHDSVGVIQLYMVDCQTHGDVGGLLVVGRPGKLIVPGEDRPLQVVGVRRVPRGLCCGI